MPSANNAAIVEISQTANKFRSSIVLQYDNKYIDVKSILGLFTTLLSSSKYDLHVHGPDEAEAKVAMAEVFAKHELGVNVVEDWNDFKEGTLRISEGTFSCILRQFRLI